VVGVSEELESPSRQSSCDTEAILEQIISNIDEQGNWLPQCGRGLTSVR